MAVKKFELRSNSNGSFDITDRTGSAERYSIDSSGNHNFTGPSMRFNGMDIFKPLVCGEIRQQTPSSNFSVGRVGFSFARTTTATAGQYTITFASPLPNTHHVPLITNIGVSRYYFWVVNIINKTNQCFSMECKKASDQSWQDNPFTFAIVD